MRHWIGLVSAEQFATERLYARDQVELPVADRSAAVEVGDRVVLVAAAAPAARPPTPRLLFGHGVVRPPADRSGVARGPGPVVVEYQDRRFDDPSPLPSDVLPEATNAGLFPLPAGQFARLATLVTAPADAGDGRSTWFVSVALPIEAATRAEAVREFWAYVEKLGPRELPAYVWPRDDELAMQAFVLGAVTNLDPEQDDED
jgi:hypothetical protein